MLPYGFLYLAWVVGRVLTKLGYDVVDILGLSWGGALAQQFAFQNPRRCRRLVLVATGTGVLMVPGHPRVLAKMLTPKRFSDPNYAASIAGDLYGGTVRTHSDEVAALFDKQLHAGSKMGYLHQLAAGLGMDVHLHCPLSGNRRLSSPDPTTRSSHRWSCTSCSDYYRTPRCGCATMVRAHRPHHQCERTRADHRRIPRRPWRTTMTTATVTTTDNADFYGYEYLLADDERATLHSVHDYMTGTVQPLLLEHWSKATFPSKWSRALPNSASRVCPTKASARRTAASCSTA